MSNTVAHLAVAREILKAHPALIQNPRAFYLGCIAPDAIGSKPDCTREDKKRVHLRSGIRDAEWLDAPQMTVFKQRVHDFVKRYIQNAAGSQRDFNIGYLVHLLTDEWNHRTLRQTMLRIAHTLQVSQSDREFFHMMTNDLEALDAYLLTCNTAVAEIFQQLLTEDVQYELPGYVEKAHMEGSIAWWKDAYLKSIYNRKLRYISARDMDVFVSVAAEKIAAELAQLL